MKKPIYKRRWFVVLAVFIFMGMVGSFIEDDDTETAKTVEQTTESTAPKAKQEAPKAEQETPKAKQEAPKAKQEAPKVDNTQAILLLMKGSFSEIGTVHYDEGQKIYILTPTDPDFVQALSYTLTSGDTQSWDRLVDSFAEMSAGITKKVGSGTSVAIANPLHPDRLILIITDGVVVRDAVNERLSN